MFVCSFLAAPGILQVRTSLVLSLKSPATLADATNALFERYPGLKRFGRSLLFAVNQEYAAPEAEHQSKR